MENDNHTWATDQAGEIPGSQAAMGCTCGQPQTVGVMHRSEGPCQAVYATAASPLQQGEDDLPPLPQAGNATKGGTLVYYADQMRAYAREAISRLARTAAPSEGQAIPTDLSKLLRKEFNYLLANRIGCATLDRDDVLAAADEIERYYGGMLNWKRTAEAKDGTIADLRTALANTRAAAPAAEGASGPRDETGKPTLAEVQKNAARYLWLRHGDNDELVIQLGPVAPDYHWLPRNERLDDMIDQHMVRQASATPVTKEGGMS